LRERPPAGHQTRPGQLGANKKRKPFFRWGERGEHATEPPNVFWFSGTKRGKVRVGRSDVDPFALPPQTQLLKCFPQNRIMPLFFVENRQICLGFPYVVDLQEQCSIELLSENSKYSVFFFLKTTRPTLF